MPLSEALGSDRNGADVSLKRDYTVIVDSLGELPLSHFRSSQ